MENNEQKTPADWFKMLKEPYRSEAIANIDVNRRNYENYPKSFYTALNNSFDWYYSKQGRDYWYKIQVSVQAGETTYLETETELKPQDMISGEWYVVETWCKYLTKFKGIENQFVNEYKGYSYKLERFNTNVPLCELGDIKSIRKATREEVLEHFPDEFKDEKKEVESELKEGEMYFYYNKADSYTITNSLNYAVNCAKDNSTIYRATPIGTKQTKSILEPIKK